MAVKIIDKTSPQEDWVVIFRYDLMTDTVTFLKMVSPDVANEMLLNCDFELGYAYGQCSILDYWELAGEVKKE